MVKRFGVIRLFLYSGDVLHVKGCNGIGKTTLLQTLGGLYHPRCKYVDTQLFVNNRQDITFSPKISFFVGTVSTLRPLWSLKRNLFYWGLLNYVDSDRGFFDFFKDWLRLKIGLTLPSFFLEDKVDSVLASVNLKDFQDVKISLLSTGQLKKANLARLWLSTHPIWLLDEPFLGLDKVSRNTIKNLILTHLSLGGIVLLASHEAFVFPRVKVLHLYT
jgi:heme exporter protein A